MERIGHYIVERELGRGGMGVVYVARHEQLGRRVAIKRLLECGPQELARFEREALTLARLRHPGIVPIHEVGQVAGNPWLAMDLIDGESLEDRLERDGPLDPQDAGALLEELAEAVGEAHRQGVLHRDLKPANVLLNRDDGRALVTDFGLARDETNAKDRLTQTGQVLGTPAYMAPEQADGDPASVGASADIYALGATLYAALTGKPPFEGPTIVNVLSSVLTKPPVPPRELQEGIDVDLETICLKCLEKAPADRYANSRELLEDLRRYRRGEPVLATRPTRWTRLVRLSQRHPSALKGFVGLTAFGLILLVAIPVYRSDVLRGLAQGSEDLAAKQRKSEETRRRRERERLEARERRDQRDLARKASELSARLEPAVARLEAGDPAGAVPLLESVWKRVQGLAPDDPVRAQVRSYYVKALYEAGAGEKDWRRVEVLDKVLSIDPDHLEALRDRAQRPRDIIQLGTIRSQYESALASADRALELGGPDAETLASRADCLAHLDRAEEALTAANEALRLEDEAPPFRGQGRPNYVRMVRAQILLTMKRWAEARDAFSYALELGQNHRAYRDRGLCHMELGDSDAARLDFRRALDAKKDPGEKYSGFITPYCDLARLEEREGRIPEALAILGEAIASDASSYEARRDRARLRYLHGELAGAEEDVLVAAQRGLESRIFVYEPGEEERLRQLLSKIRADRARQGSGRR